MSDAEKLDRKLLYHCRIFDVYEGDVRLPDGRICKQTWIDHRPTIAVVPVNPESRIVLIRQYRHSAGGMIVEIPAGNMDREGEAVESCVQRELAEEVGFQAGRLIRLYEGYLVPGYCNEYMYFYLALDLQPATLPGDEDEYIQVMTASFAEAREMIREKKIIDAKTALGIQMAREYLEGESSGTADLG
jgi:ADP-ribose pyrophosphatase